MADVLGVVCARKGSKRLKGKNLKLIGGVSLVERAVRTLSESGIDHIAVVADFEPEFDLGRYNARHIFRSMNMSGDSLALQETVKWTYYSLDETYDYVVYLMPNCPMISVEAVKKAVSLMTENRLNVVRSYNPKGEENGLIAVRTKYLLDHFTDVYCGGVVCEGDEIHDETDYLRIKEAMEGCRGDME